MMAGGGGMGDRKVTYFSIKNILIFLIETDRLADN